MLRFSILVAALLAQPLGAVAQTYPDKPIRLIVPFAAGGAGDIIARPIAEAAGAELGQPVLVDNRPGAQGVTGSQAAATSAPDGYTILLNFSTISSTQFFTKGVPYDSIKSFTPLVKAAMAPQCLVVIPSLPVRSVTDLIEYAKKQPGGLSYGSTGIGNPPHIAGELLQLKTGIKLVHVPYRGGAPVLNDLLAGVIPMAFMTLATVRPSSEAGKVRVLGVLEGKRTRIAPDLPTLGESGLPGYSIPDTWVGFLGPAGLPPPIVERLNRALNNALRKQDVRALLENAGYEVLGGTSDELAATMKQDVETYRRIVEGAGIRPQ
jgi:tripartite-type tricarboxylate transporter receptor subunit TctC